MSSSGLNAGTPGDYTIRLRPAAWALLRKDTNTQSDRALAAAIGLSHMTVYRVTTGKSEPSIRFVARTLKAFPLTSFDRLFTLALR